VLAYPAAHSAVADGTRDYLFVYLNLRMGRGRSAAVHKAVGDAVTAAAKDHLQPLFASRHIGLTVQVDEGQELYDARNSTIHPLFAKA
jgi:5-carboxymethyl-2-hydroxymuconate isomerase